VEGGEEEREAGEVGEDVREGGEASSATGVPSWEKVIPSLETAGED